MKGGMMEEREITKFQEAKDQLKKLAKGKYHTVSYELIELQDGSQETYCCMYINDKEKGRIGDGKTFSDAYNKLKKRLIEGIE
jgi:hypothetical protein